MKPCVGVLLCFNPRSLYMYTIINVAKMTVSYYLLLILTDVTVELFGSSVSGFALVSSNLNLNLNIPGAQERQVGVQ